MAFWVLLALGLMACSFPYMLLALLHQPTVTPTITDTGTVTNTPSPTPSDTAAPFTPTQSPTPLPSFAAATVTNTLPPSATSAPVNVYTPVAALGAPTLLNPLNVSNKMKPWYQWTPVTNATIYTIWVWILDRQGNKGDLIVYEQHQASHVCSSTSNKCQIRPEAELTDGRKYTWVVQAYGLPGYGPFSSQITFTADKATPTPGSAYSPCPLTYVSKFSAGNYQAVALEGDNLYVGDGSTLRILKINPSSGTFTSELELGKISLPAAIKALAVNNGFVYAADGQSGLRILNVKNPSAPYELASLSTTDASGVKYSTAYPNHLFLADGSGGLRVISINPNNPSNPVLFKQVNTSGAAEDLAIAVNGAGEKDVVYVAAGTGGVHVFDISDLTGPGGVKDAGSDKSRVKNAKGVAVKDAEKYEIWVADGNVGLLLLTLRPNTASALSLNPASKPHARYVAPAPQPGAPQAPLAAESTLTVTLTGGAYGTVTSNPSGINCGGDPAGPSCSSPFTHGAVKLNAVPLPSYIVEWEGCDEFSGNTCTVNLTSDRPIKVKFINGNLLNVSVSGSGYVTSDTGGIICDSNNSPCSAAYVLSTVVTLTASPSTSYGVIWTGCNTTNGNVCTVTMSVSKAVTAAFKTLRKVSITPPPFSGGVIDAQEGVQCDSDDDSKIKCGEGNFNCCEKYADGASLTLSATGNNNYGVVWGGDCSGTASTCSLTVSADKAVNVSFSSSFDGAAAVASTGEKAYAVGKTWFYIADKDHSSLNTTKNLLNDARDVVVSGNFAYIADGTYGVKILKISDPASLEQTDSYGVSLKAYDVAVLGKYAFVADNNGQLVTVDISTPSAPVLKNTKGISGSNPYRITVVDPYIYMTYYPNTMQSYGGLSSGAPVERFACSNIPGIPYGLDISGNYAFISTDNSGNDVFVCNTNANGQPLYAGNMDAIGYGIKVSGSYAYVAANQKGLKVLGIPNPMNNLSVIGEYPATGTTFSGAARDVAVSGSYVYLASDTAGLYTIKISDPTAPTLAGTLDTAGNAYGVKVAEVEGKYYAFVADYASGVVVVDISDVTKPKSLCTYDTPGNARNVFVYGKYIYVADESNGLVILSMP